MNKIDDKTKHFIWDYMRIFLLINCWQTGYKTVYIHTSIHNERERPLWCGATRKQQKFTLIHRYHRHQPPIYSVICVLAPFSSLPLQYACGVVRYVCAVVSNRSFICSYCIIENDVQYSKRATTTEPPTMSWKIQTRLFEYDEKIKAPSNRTTMTMMKECWTETYQSNNINNAVFHPPGKKLAIA